MTTHSPAGDLAAADAAMWRWGWSMLMNLY